MATASGIDGQFGIVDESTYGTYVAPTRFAEMMSEGIKNTVTRIDSQGIRAGRRVLHRWASGKVSSAGPVSMELAPQGMGLLFKHMFGTVVTAGSGPYTHTYTPGPLDGKSFTTQIGRPDIGGTVRPFSYAGCKVADWEIRARVGEYCQLTVNLIAASEVTAQSLATASYASGLAPFIFTEGSLSIAAGDVCITEFTLRGDNGLSGDRHRICATTPTQQKEPLEGGLRSYEGSFVGDFESLTQYGRYTAGTEAAMVLALTTDASNDLTITANVRSDGETPNVGGIELIPYTTPFTCTSGTSDAAAITAVLTNSDAAP